MPNTANNTPKLTRIDQMPKQYSKPLRKTGYLLPYPHVVNGGILYKQHEYCQRTTQLPDDALMDLFGENEVSFSADRVKDVRAIPWSSSAVAT